MIVRSFSKSSSGVNQRKLTAELVVRKEFKSAKETLQLSYSIMPRH